MNEKKSKLEEKISRNNTALEQVNIETNNFSVSSLKLVSRMSKGES